MAPWALHGACNHLQPCGLQAMQSQSVSIPAHGYSVCSTCVEQCLSKGRTQLSRACVDAGPAGMHGHCIRRRLLCCIVNLLAVWMHTTKTPRDTSKPEIWCDTDCRSDPALLVSEATTDCHSSVVSGLHSDKHDKIYHQPALGRYGTAESCVTSLLLAVTDGSFLSTLSRRAQGVLTKGFAEHSWSAKAWHVNHGWAHWKTLSR